MNTDLTPLDEGLDVRRDLRAAVPPDFEPFDERSIYLASVIGGGLAGAVLLCLNDRRLGLGRGARHLLVGAGFVARGGCGE